MKRATFIAYTLTYWHKYAEYFGVAGITVTRQLRLDDDRRDVNNY